MKKKNLIIAILMLVELWIYQSAIAKWPNNPNVGLIICEAQGNQVEHAMISDGEGGVIVTWEDHRSGDGDIYAQRVDSEGKVLWQEGGVEICAVQGEQENPRIVSDGNGGAIIAWLSELQLYTQRVDADGNIPDSWPANGVNIGKSSSPLGVEKYPVIVSDGSGGAIIIRYDWRLVPKPHQEPITYYEIHAYRIDADGILQWTENICTFPEEPQKYAAAVSDGAGGAIITWQHELERGDVIDIYAQRVDADGEIQWPAENPSTGSIPICSASRNQERPKIISDGSGGAIIAWLDKRSGHHQIYAQRVCAGGIVQWDRNGNAICEAYSAHEPGISFAMISDSSGGAIIAWDDERNVASFQDDIYAQRVDAGGVVRWPGNNGVAICTASQSQQHPSIVSDGSGGVIIAWDDERNVPSQDDIYAQHVDANGKPQWIQGGILVSIAPNKQEQPIIASTPLNDGSIGAIIVWQDKRSGNDDIYAARIPFQDVGKTIYVSNTGNDKNDGLSWTNAKATIQAAIDAAWDGYTVLVEYGTYNITSSIDFGGHDIRLASDDGTHNRYDDASTDASECIIDAGGKCRVFYFHSRESSESVADGFTIQNGKNTGKPFESITTVGGGIFCEGSSPTIKNNIITGNSVEKHRGGGIGCKSSSPTIINNIITGNSAKYGGGISCENSSAKIANNIITENVRYGIGCFGKSSPTIINNTIMNNSDGGIYISSSTPTITNTILWGNGTLEIRFYSSGGGTVTISNSDIQGGQDGIKTTWIEQKVNWGDGNIDADPLFVDPDNGDYHLSDGSPCIGAGIMIDDVPDRDIECIPRPNPPGSNPDIGAYEYPPHTPYPQITVSPNSIAFGKAIVGEPEIVTVSIGNAGSAPLNVTQITSTLGEILTISETAFTVAAGKTHDVTLTLTPSSEGKISGTLTIISNDFDSPTIEIAITGDVHTQWDVNGDDAVDILDFVLVGSHLGETGKDLVGDINDDGTVDISDLVLIGHHFGESQ